MSRYSLLLTLTMLMTAACGGSGETATAPTATALPDDVRDVASVVAEPETATTTASAEGGEGAVPAEFTATGEFRSPVTTQLAPRVPGRVEAVYVDAGQAVRQGQPLLKLETHYTEIEARQASAQVAQARAALTEASSDFERKRGLFEKGSIPQATFDRAASVRDQAQASLNAASAALEGAQTRAADSVVRSPFNGVIVERRTAVGERLQDASVAFVIAQTAPLDLRFQMPERFLPMVRQGQPVRATVDAYPGVVFEGRVDVVAQTIDPSSRSFFVEAVFPNQDRRLRPGMFAQVTINLR